MSDIYMEAKNILQILSQKIMSAVAFKDWIFPDKLKLLGPEELEGPVTVSSESEWSFTSKLGNSPFFDNERLST